LQIFCDGNPQKRPDTKVLIVFGQFKIISVYDQKMTKNNRMSPTKNLKPKN